MTADMPLLPELERRFRAAFSINMALLTELCWFDGFEAPQRQPQAEEESHRPSLDPNRRLTTFRYEKDAENQGTSDLMPIERR